MIDATEMAAGSATRDEVVTATASLAQFESEIVDLTGRARFARHARRDPATLAGLTIVIVLVAIAILAPTIAPYGANEKVGAVTLTASPRPLSAMTARASGMKNE